MACSAASLCRASQVRSNARRQAVSLVISRTSNHICAASPPNSGLHQTGLAALPARLSYTSAVARPNRTNVKSPAPPVKPSVNPLTGALVATLLDHS